MSVWGGLKNIVDTMNRGAHQDDWNKIAAQEEAIKSEQQRRLLASNADSRAAAGEGREGERFNREKSRYGIQDEADQLGLRAGRAGATAAEWTANNQERVQAGKESEVKFNQDIEKQRLQLARNAQNMTSEQYKRQQVLIDEQVKDFKRRNAVGEATQAGQISSENYNNSEAGRTERSMGRWGTVLRDMEEGPDKQAIIAFLMKQQGIQPEEDKPGFWAGILGPTTSAKRKPQVPIGSQGARLPGMGPR